MPFPRPPRPSSTYSCSQVKLSVFCEQDRVLQDLEDKIRALKENKVCIILCNLGPGGGAFVILSFLNIDWTLVLVLDSRYYFIQNNVFAF